MCLFDYAGDGPRQAGTPPGLAGSQGDLRVGGSRGGPG